MLTAGIALAGQYTGQFEVTTSADCKFWQEDSAAYSERCQGGDRKLYPGEMAVGTEVALGVRFFPVRSVFLSAEISLAMLVYPFDRAIQLNFPVAGFVGGGAAF